MPCQEAAYVRFPTVLISFSSCDPRSHTFLARAVGRSRCQPTILACDLWRRKGVTSYHIEDNDVRAFSAVTLQVYERAQHLRTESLPQCSTVCWSQLKHQAGQIHLKPRNLSAPWLVFPFDGKIQLEGASPISEPVDMNAAKCPNVCLLSKHPCARGKKSRIVKARLASPKRACLNQCHHHMSFLRLT